MTVVSANAPAATTSDDIASPTTEAPADAARTSRRARYGFAISFSASFLVVLAALFAVNVVGNSTGLFPSDRNPSMAERAWKTRRVDDAVRRKREPGVMILGSSRVMQIQPAYVEGLTKEPTFNYGVSAA